MKDKNIKSVAPLLENENKFINEYHKAYKRNVINSYNNKNKVKSLKVS